MTGSTGKGPIERHRQPREDCVTSCPQADMIIKSHLPALSLRHLVKEYYFFNTGPLSQSRFVPVIDDGCYDFIFFREQDSALVWGPGRSSLPIPYKVFTIHQLQPPYRIRFGEQLTFFTIKVQPWANAHFFSGLQRPGVVDLLPFFPEMGGFRPGLLGSALMEEKCKLADGIMAGQNQILSPTAQWVRDICEAIYRDRGMTTVGALSERFGKSRQYISRIFRQQVLYSLKHFILTVRIMDLVRYRIKHPEISMTELCYRYDYFDQPHFNRDFRRICGVTPTGFFGNLPDFLLRH